MDGQHWQAGTSKSDTETSHDLYSFHNLEVWNGMETSSQPLQEEFSGFYNHIKAEHSSFDDHLFGLEYSDAVDSSISATESVLSPSTNLVRGLGTSLACLENPIVLKVMFPELKTSPHVGSTTKIVCDVGGTDRKSLRLPSETSSQIEKRCPVLMQSSVLKKECCTNDPNPDLLDSLKESSAHDSDSFKENFLDNLDSYQGKSQNIHIFSSPEIRNNEAESLGPLCPYGYALPSESFLSQQTVSNTRAVIKVEELAYTVPLHEQNVSDADCMWEPFSRRGQFQNKHCGQSKYKKEKSPAPKAQSLTENLKLRDNCCKMMNSLPSKDVLHFARFCFRKALNAATSDVMKKMTELTKQSKLNPRMKGKTSNSSQGLPQAVFTLSCVNSKNTEPQNQTIPNIKSRQNHGIANSKRCHTHVPKQLQQILPRSAAKLLKKQCKRIAHKKMNTEARK